MRVARKRCIDIDWWAYGHSKEGTTRLREGDETGRWRRRGKRTEFVLLVITQRRQPPFCTQVFDDAQLIVVDRADGGKAQVEAACPAVVCQ